MEKATPKSVWIFLVPGLVEIKIGATKLKSKYCDKSPGSQIGLDDPKFKQYSHSSSEQEVENPNKNSYIQKKARGPRNQEGMENIFPKHQYFPLKVF